MDSLQDLLGRYAPKEPAEIAPIKQYIDEHFQATCLVAVKDSAIIVTVYSAALAGTLRFHMRKLQASSATDKRIIIRIG